MRHTSRVLSLSWIPSEAVTGLALKMPFEIGIAHYDEPLPDVVDDVESLLKTDAFRFANELRAWIDVDDGRILDAGYDGGGHIGSTTMKLGRRRATFAAVPFSLLQDKPEFGPTSVRFVQTSGGRAGVPAPRRVKHPPFVKVSAPTAWTTLALTIHADGSSDHEVVGASSFPRHWIYDAGGRLVAKTGLIDFNDWAKTAFGRHTPWGDEDSPALVTEVESALERELSRSMMKGNRKAKVRKLKQGETLVEQGEEGREMFLLLDGVLSVEVNGDAVAELGPGALLGERALLESGRRTSTLRAVSACKVAVVVPDDVDPAKLVELSEAHHREDR